MEKKRSIYSFYYEWWKNIDKFIFFLIILLFITGLFFSLVSTSLIVSDELETNDYTFFFKHLLFVFKTPIDDEKLVDLESLIMVKSFFSKITC